MIEPAGPGASRVTLALRNTGWAAIASPRPPWLVICRGSVPVFAQPLPVDLSAMKPDAAASFSFLLPAAGWLPPGSYAAALYAPDPAWSLVFDPRYALLFENLGVPDPASGLNRLVSFTVTQ